MGDNNKGVNQMEKYQIEAYNNGDVVFTVVVQTMDAAKQEMGDALHDGFQVLITKLVLQKQGE